MLGGANIAREPVVFVGASGDVLGQPAGRETASVDTAGAEITLLADGTAPKPEPLVDMPLDGMPLYCGMVPYCGMAPYCIAAGAGAWANVRDDSPSQRAATAPTVTNSRSRYTNRAKAIRLETSENRDRRSEGAGTGAQRKPMPGGYYGIMHAAATAFDIIGSGRQLATGHQLSLQ
ncbi:MAG TPA: hypothetical protein VG713_07095 [Pirellulales bacterium]|nr:hypothetical protein [Pirellulales bacterium]